MKEVKWIKLAADIFDNRKIKQIEALPDGDAIIVIWLKLLCLAGTINDGGLVYFTREIPYTEEMMATQFCRPLQTVKLALQVFERFGMIEKIEDLLQVSNWERYQNIEGLEHVRQLTRERVRRHRELKQLEAKSCNVTSNATVTQSNALDIESDIESDSKKSISKEIPKESAASSKTAPRASKPKPEKHRFGEYSNVLLTTEEFKKLETDFPQDYKERIDALSRYMKSTGKAYKDHLATIRNWARRDGEERQKNKRQEQQIGTRTNYDYNSGANAVIFEALEQKKREREGKT